MVSIALTSLFANINTWPGQLLQEQEGNFVITARTTTTFSYRIGATDPDFPN